MKQETLYLRITACLLAALLLLPGMIACADTQENTPTPTSAPTAAETGTPTPQPTGAEDAVPDYLLTLPQREGEKRDFTILSRDTHLYEIWVNENEVDGDLMSQSVFSRNSRVEEYENVNICYMNLTAGWDERKDCNNLFINAAKTGDVDFDVSSTYMAYSSDMVVAGLLHDINTIRSIDIENPWWAEGFTKNNCVFDRMYMIAGDLSLSMWKDLYVTYFNKQLAMDAGIGNLYSDVDNEEWTFDLMLTYSSLVSADNGDDVWDEKDSYGLMLNRHALRAMVTSFDIRLTEENDEGGFDLCMYNERSVDIYDAMYNAIFRNAYVYMDLLSDEDITLTVPMMMENRGLFLLTTLEVAEQLRNMETDFGILPFPKYDDEQEEYYTHCYDGFSVFIIPLLHPDCEFVGEIMEALNAESKHSVIPNYYEIVLKNRTSRDSDSARMLDIARDTLLFDFAFTHCCAMDLMLNTWSDNMAAGNSSFTTVYESRRAIFENDLEKLMKIYEDGID